MLSEADIRSLSDEDLISLATLVAAERHVRRAASDERKRMELRVGDRVKFADRFHRTVQGRVTKICLKNFQVHDEAGVRWTVSPNLLTRVSESSSPN